MENSTNDRVLWNSLFLIVLKTKYRQDLWKHLTDFSRASNVFLPMWVVVKSVYLCIVSRLQFGRTPIVCTVVNTNFVNANFVLTRFQTYSVLLFLTANPPADKCNELCKDRELDPKLYESAKKLTSARKAGTFGSSMKSWNWTWNRWNFPNDHYSSHNPSIDCLYIFPVARYCTRKEKISGNRVINILNGRSFEFGQFIHLVFWLG